MLGTRTLKPGRQADQGRDSGYLLCYACLGWVWALIYVVGGEEIGGVNKKEDNKDEEGGGLPALLCWAWLPRL